MPRDLKKRSVVLSNEVQLTALPISKSKGRHWRATQRGRVIGEFLTWQQTTYVRQKEGDYGRGGGSYHTSMRRWSWLASAGEKEVALDDLSASLTDEEVAAQGVNVERQFYDWKKALREVPHPLVKKIA